MKKTKILVPALGMMLLSTAAAVSGTMAWFSANRSVTVSTNNFAIEALDGSLVASAANLVGTTADNETTAGNPVISILEGYKLLDASFDEASGQEKLYTDVRNDAGNITGFEDLGALPGSADNTAWKAASGNYYYGIAWSVTFTYTFKGDTRDLDLFFDFAGSTATYSAQTGAAAATNAYETHKGYRIAMINGNNRVVWAPFRASSEGTPAAAKTYHHVNGEGQTAFQNYTNHTDILLSDTATAASLDKAADSTNGNTSRPDYLGTITNTAGTGSQTVKFVCWYEGEDENVVNGAAMEQVSTAMSFYVRTAYSA